MQRNENDSSKSSSSVFLTIGLLLALHCTCLSTLLHAAQDALQTIWQTGVRGGINKLAKLRRHASQVHVWSGVEWCEVVWCGVVWSGVEWSFFSLFTLDMKDSFIERVPSYFPARNGYSQIWALHVVFQMQYNVQAWRTDTGRTVITSLSCECQLSA